MVGQGEEEGEEASFTLSMFYKTHYHLFWLDEGRLSPALAVMMT